MIKFLCTLPFVLMPLAAFGNGGSPATTPAAHACAGTQRWSGISCYTPVKLTCGGATASAATCACPAAPSWHGAACHDARLSRLAGPRHDYTLARTATGSSATLRGEKLMFNQSAAIAFSDITVNLTIGTQSQAIGAADLRMLIELYIAFFNRLPDADGLAFWIGELGRGKTIDQIADSFYAVAIQYPAMTGYAPAMRQADFVRIIYQNVLGRSGASAPPDADVQYWAYQLDSARSSRGGLVRAILTAAHAYSGDATWGWVTQLLDKKYYVGHYFAVQQGINYRSPEENIRRTAAIAAAITPTDMAAAITLIGVADPGFSLTDNLVLALDYGGFKLDYSCTNHSAQRYEYALGFDTGSEPRPSSFTLDPDLPAHCGQQATTGSYAAVETGWDRGHLVTSNHMDYNAPYMKRANYMTNIVPQNSVFNQGIWLKAENVAECYRDLAPLTVYGGVVYNDAANDKFMTSHGIPTPDYFWKVIVTTDAASGATRAIAWYIPNRDNLGPLDSYLVSIRDLEQRIGATNVGVNVPDAVKLGKPSVSWPLPGKCDLG